MVIRSNCTICTEGFEGEKPIAACNCGHTFHEECIHRWVRTSSTCPQCRSKSTMRTIIRLYWEKPDDDEEDVDPTKLKNELDTLSAELARKDQEKAVFLREKSEFADTLQKKQNKIKTISNKLASEQITTDTLKKQLSLLSLQMEEAKAAKKEAKRLREQLQLLERFQLVITRDSEAVEDMLNESGDGPKAARELATYCVALKREFQNGKDSKRRLKEENERLKKETSYKGKKVMERTLEVERLEKRVRSLEDDLNQVEAEKAAMKDKMTTLQRALESPSSSGSKSAISRLIMESPAPSLLQRPNLSGNESIDLDDVTMNPGSPATPTFLEPSPSIQAKTDCREFNVPYIKTTSAATKRKRLKEQEEDDAVVMSAICNSSLFNSKRPLRESQSITKKGYNGMGGHEKFFKSSFANSKPVARKAVTALRKKTGLAFKTTPPLPTLEKFL
ncbi:E3 ubiquitin-protein ligase TRAIP-like [Amphiura filiformis]|uniref:E3 ubiquitin-protein ligase TRAIP-like n=1 Tax=Amphiura filiformis TaxID=82378 RepID=UPI003B20DCA7